MSKFVIRKATENDAESLLKIYEPYITNTTITFEYDVPTAEAFADRIDLLELQGLRHLYSCVTLPNEKSIRMQRRLGFADAGVWHDSGWKFDGWHDVAWLEKHIGSGKPQPVTPFPALDEKNIQECLQKYMDKLNQVEE